jgi:hypothetical protein
VTPVTPLDQNPRTRDDFTSLGDSVRVTVLRRGVAGPAVAGLVVLLGGMATASGWLDWSKLGRWLRPNAGLIITFAVAAALLAKAVLRAVRRGPERKPARALSWWVVAAAAAVVTGVAWAATTWLLREADRAADPPAARVEAIKTGLGTAAGAAGVFALLLAVRRQWHQELSSAATELDAAEKRVTELYTKAVEQLGSAQAPVRLGGLYALERVAQNNPDQRQTIVNVLCAYLRMPYQLPSDPPAEGTDEQLVATHRERIQEREVRLTAQGILANHLYAGYRKTPVPTFWRDIDLDLTGAALIDFDLTSCTVHNANFQSATFTGETIFTFALFTMYANFRAATFINIARFVGTTFIGHVDFESATFTSHVYFESATFDEGVPEEVARFLPESAESEAAEQVNPPS